MPAPKDPEKYKLFIKRTGDASRGRKHTEEYKQKMREQNIGEKNSFFGRKHSKESRERMSKSHKKYYVDHPESIEQIRSSLTGKKQTPESNKKRSETLSGRFKGENHWGYGKHHTEEHKKKISNGTKGMKHEPLSEESLKKMGNSIKQLWKDPEYHKKMCKLHKGLQAKEKHPNWKGGITSLVMQIRSCDEYSSWKTNVFERDGYCDWFSGLKGNGNLNAHHIIPFAALLKRYNINSLDDAISCEALWDVNNGVTMFDKTHLAYHSMWGKYDGGYTCQQK